MHLSQKFGQKSVVHNILILLGAVALSTTIVTDAVAARAGGGSGRGSAGFGGGHMSRGFGVQLPEGVPSMPAPVFNPSEPYTLPESPETPVSPASPGSIFGNG